MGSPQFAFHFLKSNKKVKFLKVFSFVNSSVSFHRNFTSASSIPPPPYFLSSASSRSSFLKRSSVSSCLPSAPSLLSRCSFYNSSSCVSAVFSRCGRFCSTSSSSSSSSSSLCSSEVEGKLLDLLRRKNVKNLEEIKTNSNFESFVAEEEHRKWDCLDTVEFLLDVEEEFGIAIPDNVADNMQTLQEVLDYVLKAKQGNAADIPEEKMKE